MFELKIKAQTVIKVGNSHYIGIPAQYIKDGVVVPGKEYDMEITEVE